MRIEGILQAGNTPAILPEQTPLLQAGDVVHAAVLQNDSGGVVLRTEDGGVLQARLATDALLMPGDNAELVVTQSTADKLVLRLVQVEQQQDAVVVDRPLPKGIATEAASPELRDALRAFGGMEGKPSPQMLARAVQLMREQGLDAKSAVFFAANEIEPTQTAQNALQNLIDGNTVGKTLLELAQSLDADIPAASASEQDGQAAGVRPGAVGALPVSEHKAQEATPGQQRQDAATVRQGGAAPGNLVGQQEAQQGQTPKQVVPPQGEAQQSIVPDAGQPIVSASDAEQQNINAAKMPARQADIPEQTQSAQRDAQMAHTADTFANVPVQPEHMPQHAQAPKGVQPQQAQETEVLFNISQQEDFLQPARTLPGKAASLFAKAEEGMDGQALRRSAQELGESLQQLQQTVKSADIYDKQAVIARLGDAQAQLKLTQDISRFLCMQIPVQMQEHQTAELYVYRRNRKGGKIDPENTCIVLGIDTQNAGRVEALIRVENRAISIAFSVEKEETVPMFRRQTEELKRAIAGLQFSLTQCSVARLCEATTPVNAEQALCAGIRKKHGVSIDYRV